MSPTNDLLSYLHNNLPLPDELIQPWQSHRDDLTHSISTKDREIRELKRQLNLLEEESFRLKEERVLVTSLRSAVRRLPAELIALIMYFTVELNKGPLGRAGRRDFMALRSVSPLWRETAFTTPYLWKSLAVDFSPEYIHHRARRPSIAPIGIINSWFARAGQGCYVNLSIQDMSACIKDPWAYLPQLLDNQSQFQLCALEIVPGILRSEQDQRSLYTPSASKTRLKSLSIHCKPFVVNLDGGQNSDTDPCQLPRLPLSEAFPQLECLSLKGNLSTFGALTHPTLKSLILEVTSSTIPLFSQLVHGLPALEELIIISLDLRFITDGAPVQLPSLKRLTLLEDPTLRLSGLLALFICPQLQCMHLISQDSNTNYGGFPVEDKLRLLVERSRAPHFTLRVTGHRPRSTLSQLFSLSLPVHRLDVPSVDWLPGHEARRRFMGLYYCLPSSLRDIYIREGHTGVDIGLYEPEFRKIPTSYSRSRSRSRSRRRSRSRSRRRPRSRSRQGRFGQANPSSTAFDSEASFCPKLLNGEMGDAFQPEGSGSQLNTEITHTSVTIVTQDIDIYAPGIEEKEAARQGVNLRAHHATEEWIADFLHRDNPIVYDGYETLVQRYVPAPVATSVTGGQLARKSSQDSISSERSPARSEWPPARYEWPPARSEWPPARSERSPARSPARHEWSSPPPGWPGFFGHCMIMP